MNRCHAYVRGQLRKKYGHEIVPAHGPIPAASAGEHLEPGMGQRLFVDGIAKALHRATT